MANLFTRISSLEQSTRVEDHTDLSALAQKATHLKGRLEIGVSQIQFEVRDLGASQCSEILSLLTTMGRLTIKIKIIAPTNAIAATVRGQSRQASSDRSSS